MIKVQIKCPYCGYTHTINQEEEEEFSMYCEDDNRKSENPAPCEQKFYVDIKFYAKAETMKLVKAGETN